METTRDTCKYKIVRRVRERLKETKETGETDWKRLKRLRRLWRPLEIHECNMYVGTEGL